MADGDVYFSVASFPEYGKLSGRNVEELLCGVRVSVDEAKRSCRFCPVEKSQRGRNQLAVAVGRGQTGLAY